MEIMLHIITTIKAGPALRLLHARACVLVNTNVCYVDQYSVNIILACYDRLVHCLSQSCFYKMELCVCVCARIYMYIIFNRYCTMKKNHVGNVALFRRQQQSHVNCHLTDILSHTIMNTSTMIRYCIVCKQSFGIVSFIQFNFFSINTCSLSIKKFIKFTK